MPLLALTLSAAAARARPYQPLDESYEPSSAPLPPTAELTEEQRDERRRAHALEEGEYDFSYGPDCYYGAPPTDTNYDCPYPLARSDRLSPWDDRYTWGYTVRASYFIPTLGGPGLAVRRYAARHIAFEASADLLFGQDALGESRTELPLSLDFLYYFYRGGEFHGHLLSGLGVGWAWTKGEEQDRRDFLYGLRLGGGVTVMGSRDAVWGVDVVGFVRERAYGSRLGNPLSGEQERSVGTLLRLSASLLPVP
jgi:hypothetical protein